MHPYIKKLRSKPEHVKKSILAFALVVSMSLVSLVWFYNIGDRFGDKKMAEKTREDVKPFTLLGDSISNTVKDISASVSNAPSIKDKMTEEEAQAQIQNDIQQPATQPATQPDTSTNNNQTQTQN